MDDNKIREIVAKAIDAYTEGSQKIVGENHGDEIPVEASGRHVHLSRHDVDILFGKGYEPKKKKDISQPGQFMCEERLTITGPKGQLKNVALLGPVRQKTQVELSLTDARALGVKAEVKMSGDLDGAADIFIMAGDKMINAKESTIVAKNHIHMTPDDGRRFNVSNGETVNVQLVTNRPITFNDVPVRISENAGLAMHIDFDEANAAAFKTGDKGRICKCETKTSAIRQTTTACGDSYTESSFGKKEYAVKGKLLTENQIREAVKCKAEIILIKKGTIIGPMAKDYLREKRIETRFI